MSAGQMFADYTGQVIGLFFFVWFLFFIPFFFAIYMRDAGF